ncbi:hypothetical protein ACLKA7_011988 [Drosophila subpalustris]
MMGLILRVLLKLLQMSLSVRGYGLGATQVLVGPALVLRWSKPDRTAHINTNQLSTTRRVHEDAMLSVWNVECWTFGSFSGTQFALHFSISCNAAKDIELGRAADSEQELDTGEQAGHVASCGMQLSKRKSSPHPCHPDMHCASLTIIIITIIIITIIIITIIIIAIIIIIHVVIIIISQRLFDSTSPFVFVSSSEIEPRTRE